MKTSSSGDILQRFNPAVPRRYLYVVSAVVWTLAGALLCIRATAWLNAFDATTETMALAGSAVMGVTGYLFGFSRIVKKNIGRIRLQPDRTCVFAFTAWRGYLMIAVMVTLGVTLRSSPISKAYLSIPYAIMGSVLLIGSTGFYREFFHATPQVNSNDA